MKKRIISAVIGAATLLSAFAGCSAPAVPADESSVTVTSSALSSYGDWLEARLEADGVPATEIIIGDAATADEYGLDLSDFACDEGYIIRRDSADEPVLIFGIDAHSVDMAVRYYANYCDKSAPLNVVEGEDYRVGSVTISGHDLSEFVIVCPDDADYCHRFGATELQRFLGEACGIYPEIVPESDGLAISLICEKSGETYGDEAFNIKSHEKGITITGGRYRGCMYGVYTFLEKFIGYRFYYANIAQKSDVQAATAYVYKSDSIVIDAGVDHTEFPSIHARDTHGGATASPALKHNGWSVGIGGAGVVVKACHGYSGWIPDWELQEMGYEMGYDYNINPCFTDEYLNELLIERILDYCKSCENSIKNGAPPTIDVAQHDCGNFCMCENCLNVYKTTGNVSGAVVRLGNMVAEAIEDAGYPDVPVAILAYYGTDVAPTNIEIHKNVYISYCFYVDTKSHFICGNHSINGTECADNKYFADRYDEWAALTDNLYVWYYPFQCYYRAYSSTYTNNIYHDIKYLAECNTYGIFFHQEGDDVLTQTHDAGLINFYMGQRMMWDATISEEEYHEIMKEFIWLAYGDAGDAVYEYVQMMERSADQKGCFTGFHSSILDKLDFSYLKKNMDYLLGLRETAIRYARDSMQEELCRSIFASALYYQLVVLHNDMWVNGDDASRTEYKAMVDSFLVEHSDLPLGDGANFSYVYPPSLSEVDYDMNPIEWNPLRRAGWDYNYDF